MALDPIQKKKIDFVLTKAHQNYGPKLEKRAFFKLRDRMLCQDLVQETFLKTWKYLVKGGKIETMQAFLYHVLNDLIKDEYRKTKPISLDALMKKGFEPGVNDVSRLINRLDGKAAVLLIQLLPTKYQKIMLLRYVDDLTLKEISDMNGQSKNTNSVQLHRGLEMIKELKDEM